MSQERDICIRCGRRVVIIVCLAPPSSLVSTRHYLPSAPPNSHRSLTQMPPKPPKTNEKIWLVAIEKYSRENISDKTAQIFLLSLREWRARRSKLPAEQAQQNVATVLLSPLNHLSSRGLCPITINRDVTPLSQGPHITHLLSEELRFVVGTHLSIETSWPLPLPAHHWITMVSLLWGERTDLDRRAETLLTGTTGGTKRWQSGERAFSGRCL